MLSLSDAHSGYGLSLVFGSDPFACFQLSQPTTQRPDGNFGKRESSMLSVRRTLVVTPDANAS